MKTTFLTFLLASILILSGCTYNSMTDNTDQPISEEEKIIVQTEDGFQSPLVYDLSGENGEYTFFFDEDNMSKTFTIHHDGKQQNIVYFINDGFNKIIVDIDLPETDTGANLRLSMITMPDGTTDGPFGLYTEYELTQNGGYQLRISESLMAGDSWTGNAQVTISLSK